MASTNTNLLLRVSPPPNTINGDSTLPLTFFDTFWLKFPPVERLFFYKLTDLTHHKFDSEILPKLKHSLSLALLHYPPIAGHIKWPPQHPKPSIFFSPSDCVSVTVAESNADFDSISSNDVLESAQVRSLIPELLTSDESAELISIQITLFPNRGFSIGISTHHSIFDGKSSTNFIKSWAYLCKSEKPNLPPELTPSFDRTVINDPEGAAAVSFVEKWFGLDGQYKSDPNSRSLKVFPFIGTIQDRVRATFELSPDDIDKLRGKVKEYEANESKKLHLSTFVLTCAYVFACIIKARGGDEDREVIIGFTADYRTRMDPPIPSNYFGNCVTTQLRFAKAGEFMEENSGLCVAAEKLSEAIKGLGNGGAIEDLEEIFALFKRFKPGTQALGTAGSTVLVFTMRILGGGGRRRWRLCLLIELVLFPWPRAEPETAALRLVWFWKNMKWRRLLICFTKGSDMISFRVTLYVMCTRLGHHITYHLSHGFRFDTFDHGALFDSIVLHMLKNYVSET